KESESKTEKERSKEKKEGTYTTKVEEYSSSFTIHGLSRSIHTNSRLERIFWALTLSLAIVVACLLVQTLINKFWRQDVYVKSETRVTKNNTFPAVTFCLRPIAQFFKKYEFCELRANDALPGKFHPSLKSCNTKAAWWETLFHFENMLEFSYVPGQIEIDAVPARNFNIMCPRSSVSSMCVQDYLDEKYFRTLNGSWDCIQWNYNGDFSNSQNRIDLQLTVDSFHEAITSVVAYVHDHQESPIPSDRFVRFERFSNTEIQIKKSIRKKIKRESPNNCENQYYNNPKNIFPGKYSVEACIETNTCLEALKKCGEVIDFCRSFIPHPLLERHWVANQSLVDVHDCLYEGYRKGLFDADGEICPPPCDRTFFSTSMSATRRIPPTSAVVSLLFTERNVYETQTETVLYTWEDVLAGVGGMIGLFCGFSILSFAELIIYAGLKMLLFFRKDKQKRRRDYEMNDAIPGSAVNQTVNQ
uniref:Uncharacterized protein n=2 Tax=Clytia hemisphaerica TaxID=252671 RepID=A0A7M6DP91_9CNID